MPAVLLVPPLDKFQTLFETTFEMERMETQSTDLTATEGGPTRERLIEVAERLFAERGFAATSVRHITAEARIDPTSFLTCCDRR